MKNLLLFSLAIGNVLFSCPGFLTAQVDNPAKWEEFVTGSGNLLERDTFLLQSFSNPQQDNWNYRMLSGEGKLLDVEELGIKDATSPLALQLFPGNKVMMDSYSNSIYKNVLVSTQMALRKINTNEVLYFMLTNSSPGIEPKTLTRFPPNDNYTCNFYGKIGDSGHSVIQASGDYTDLTISIEGSKRGDDAYYCLDHVCAYGDIQQYSLFTSNGNWNDPDCWSHLPALRKRNALIQSQTTVTVDKPVGCNEVHLDGEIRLSGEGVLSPKSITVYREFPEKGTWYFVSFPFDVYAGSVGPDIQQGDETTTGSGNYFYVRTYDSESRANRGVSPENWAVVKKQDAGKLLFQKGKGYLLALDAGATITRLHFSSRPKQQVAFSAQESIPITAGTVQGAKPEESGWILCGNPLPASLNLTDISPAEHTDGNIYVYHNGKYQAYPIGSPHSLPVGAAFFVKADTDTELQIQTKTATSSTPIPITQNLSGALAEPADETPVSRETIHIPDIRIQGSTLYLPAGPRSRRIEIFDLSGKRIHTTTVSPAETILSLPESKKLQLIRITDGEKEKVIKRK